MVKVIDVGSDKNIIAWNGTSTRKDVMKWAKANGPIVEVEKCDLATIYYIQGLILYLFTTYCSHELFMWMASLSNVGFWWKQSHPRPKINLGNGTNLF